MKALEMIAKSIFLLLGVILLLEGYNAAPYKDLDSALQVLQKRLQLLHFTTTDHKVVDNEILSNGYSTMKKVLEDPKVLDIKTDEMQTALDEIRSFVKKYEEYEKSGKESSDLFQDLIEEYDRITCKFTEKDPPYSKVPKTLLFSFQENGFKKFDANADPRMKDITERFYAEVKKYYDGLTETEKEQQSDIQKWIDEFQQETDTERKDDLVWVFFGRIKLEDFLW